MRKIMKDTTVMFEKLQKRLENSKRKDLEYVCNCVLEFGIQNLLVQNEQQTIAVVQQLLRVAVEQSRLGLTSVIVEHLKDASIKFPLPDELWECYASIGSDRYKKYDDYYDYYLSFRQLVNVDRSENLLGRNLERLATMAESAYNIGIAVWLNAFIDTSSVEEADRIAQCNAFNCDDGQAVSNWDILSGETRVTCVELYHKFKTSTDLNSEYLRLLSELSSEHGLTELANYYLLRHYIEQSEIEDLIKLSVLYVYDDYHRHIELPIFKFLINILESSELSEDTTFKRFDLYSQSEPLKKAIQDGVVTTLEECEKLCPTENVKRWAGKI